MPSALSPCDPGRCFCLEEAELRGRKDSRADSRAAGPGSSAGAEALLHRGRQQTAETMELLSAPLHTGSVPWQWLLFTGEGTIPWEWEEERRLTLGGVPKGRRDLRGDTERDRGQHRKLSENRSWRGGGHAQGSCSKLMSTEHCMLSTGVHKTLQLPVQTRDTAQPAQEAGGSPEPP